MLLGFGSDVGRVRETNEDSLFCGESLFVVADGMGGYAAGEVASQLAVQTVKGWRFPSGHLPVRAAVQELERSVHAANQAVYDRALHDPATRGMGTTLTAALIVGGGAVIAHVGDSRAYLVKGGEIEQVTQDHSVVGELVRSGGITRREAERHPYRNMLTRALGTSRHVDVDIVRVPIAAGEGLLLCTDGLTTVLRDEEIAAIIARHVRPEAAVDELIAATNARGGPDNVSLILLYPGDRHGE